MKVLMFLHFNLLFLAAMLMGGCLQQPSPASKVESTLNADTVQYQTYSSVILRKFKTITLEKLPTIMMGKNVAINTLCLSEKNDPEDHRKFWCVACDTSMGVRFVENYPEEPHSLLVIKKDTIVLDKMHFQFDNEQNQPIGDFSYSFRCDHIRQIILNQDSFLTFTASFFMCNGSICGYGLEFLYHINTKQLYGFELFRGRGYFGDINQDMVLDYMELNPKSPDILDTVDLRFYTLNMKQRVFQPLKDEKGEIKVIWLVAVGQDKDITHDYRFAKRLKVIQNPPVIQ